MKKVLEAVIFIGSSVVFWVAAITTAAIILGCIFGNTGCSNGATEPGYVPTVGPLRTDVPIGYCVRSYSNKNCGDCHIIN